MKSILTYFYSLIIIFLIGCSSSSKNKVDLPNGQVLENILVEDLYNIYPYIFFHQNKGFVLLDSNYYDIQFTILTDDRYFSILRQEEIEKAKKYKVKGFLSNIDDRQLIAVNKHLTILPNIKKETIRGGYKLVKNGHTIGCLISNSLNKGSYIYILTRDKDIINGYLHPSWE